MTGVQKGRFIMKKKTKLFAAVLAVALSAGTLAGTVLSPALVAEADSAPAISTIPGTVRREGALDGSYLSVTGFAAAGVTDRSHVTPDSEAYATVSTPETFFQAIRNAQAGKVKAIEIQEDLNLGWLELSEQTRKTYEGLVEPYTGSLTAAATPVANPTLIESGISCITINNVNGLTIFSKTGRSIRHCEIKLNSGVNDVIIRNLRFTDTWEWDDWRSNGFGSTGGKGNHKRTGWTYLKLNGCNNVWVDHCSFGISFDGNVDIENGSHGITLSWCTFGDQDFSQNGMLYRTASYLEAIYQKSLTDDATSSFTAYKIMRDNGMTMEQIMRYMAYHSKCHLVGSGDKDTWYVAQRDENGNVQYDPETGLVVKVPDESKTNANERLRLTLAYNHYVNMGQRVPMIRGGVGHLYNCYVDDMEFAKISQLLNSDPKKTGKTIRQQIEEAGGTVVLLTRGMDARNEASIAADTCVYYGCSQPIVGSEFQNDDQSNLNGAYADFFGYNHALIVNSSVQKLGEDQAYVGSSWDNGGDNPFVAYKWHDRSTIGRFHWGQEGDSLPYEYQTFPLSQVVDNVTRFGGSGTLNLTETQWLSTQYGKDMTLTLTNPEDIPQIQAIALNKEQAVIYADLDEYLQLTPQLAPSSSASRRDQLTWTSDNPSVAQVTDSGLVIPKGYGDARITVTAPNGISATCQVSVKKAVQSIQILLPDVIRVGDQFQLNAQVLPEDAADSSVKWSVTGGNLLLLDEETGLVQAKSEGSATIVATARLTGNRIGVKAVTARKVTKVSPALSILPGDANQDGTVDLKDATLTLQAALGITSLSESAIDAADVDEDGTITLNDALLVLKLALGIQA